MKIERSKIKEQTLGKELRAGQELLLSGFESLLDLAERGSEDGAELLTQCLIAILARFLKTCEEKPELFYGAADKRSIWPALMSLDPTVRASHRHYDPDWICNRVNLGERTGLKYKGKLASIALGSRVARHLFALIKIQQQQTSPPVPIHYGGVVLTRQEAAQFRARCKRLPVLSRNSKVLEQWWSVMRTLIDMRYGEFFEDHEVFAKFRTDIKELQKRQAYAAKYATGYQIRDRILKDIRQGLRSIAR